MEILDIHGAAALRGVSVSWMRVLVRDGTVEPSGQHGRKKVLWFTKAAAMGKKDKLAPEALLDVREAAVLAKTNRNRVWMAVRAGKLSATRIGGVLAILADDVKGWAKAGCPIGDPPAA